MITIYTDGSSIGNPGPGGWGAIIWYSGGVVKELGGKHEHTTNNRMELLGAIEALNYVSDSADSVHVFTDSNYLVNGITKWVHGWQKNGWLTGSKEPVLNKELWEELFFLTKKMKTMWSHLPAHVGIPPNERVDEIAQGMSRGLEVNLYEGGYEDYGINLVPPSKESIKNTRLARSKKSKSSKAYSYLSVVGGKAKRHLSWEDCKKRVLGVKGARYKKSFSAESEKEILKSWGVSL